MDRDLASPRVARNLVHSAAYIAVGLLVHSAYLLVDLYWIARQGGAAVAGVSAVGFSALLANAGYQVIYIGATSLIARAAGARDARSAGECLFVAMALALACAAGVLALGYGAGGTLMRGLCASPGAAAAASAYLAAALPSFALMFPVTLLSSALRAVGRVRGPTVVYVGSTLLKMALTPLLVAGWGPIPALGVVGAGLASSLAIVVSLVAMAWLFRRNGWLRLHAVPPARWPADWRRIVGIGLPASIELGMMFATSVAIQWAVRGAGVDAQAGFGAAMRLAQVLLVPAMAMALALAPQVGQCHGAGREDRMRASLGWAALLTASAMLAIGLLVLAQSDALVAPVASDPRTAREAARFLGILSVAFVPTGLAYVASAYLQGIGVTVPTMLASLTRVVTCVLPAVAMALAGRVDATGLVWLSVASVFVQAATAWWLLGQRLWPARGAPACEPA